MTSNGVFKVVYERDTPAGEPERCEVYMDECWNVVVEPLADGAEARNVEGWALGTIMNFITAHMRPLERLEITCLV